MSKHYKRKHRGSKRTKKYQNNSLNLFNVTEYERDRLKSLVYVSRGVLIIILLILVFNLLTLGYQV